MIRHKAGEKVEKGVYWNMSSGRRVDIDEDVGMLPGGDSSTYIKVSSGIMIILGPVLGLAFVIALPFMAIGTIAVLLIGKVSGAVLNLASKVVYFEWRPTEAYLAGKRKNERKKEKKGDSGEA
jgi:hypothetical protein